VGPIQRPVGIIQPSLPLRRKHVVAPLVASQSENQFWKSKIKQRTTGKKTMQLTHLFALEVDILLHQRLTFLQNNPINFYQHGKSLTTICYLMQQKKASDFKTMPDFFKSV